jgi:glycosyltransferase involved in cell wall biosynthesis
MPKASYCISVSRPTFLEQTLESVLSQTLKDIEILISDRGDLKGDPILPLRDYRDSRMRKIPRKGDTATKSINELIEAAQSDIILYLGDDDWDEPEKAQTVYEELQTGECDIVLVGYNAVNWMGTTFASVFQHNCYDLEKHMHLGRNYINMAGGFRKSKCPKYNENLDHISDYAWFLEANRMGCRVKSIRKILCNIRNWDGQMSAQLAEVRVKEHEIFHKTYGIHLNR